MASYPFDNSENVSLDPSADGNPNLAVDTNTHTSQTNTLSFLTNHYDNIHIQSSEDTAVNTSTGTLTKSESDSETIDSNTWTNSRSGHPWMRNSILVRSDSISESTSNIGDESQSIECEHLENASLDQAQDSYVAIEEIGTPALGTGIIHEDALQEPFTSDDVINRGTNGIMSNEELNSLEFPVLPQSHLDGNKLKQVSSLRTPLKARTDSGTQQTKRNIINGLNDLLEDAELELRRFFADNESLGAHSEQPPCDEEQKPKKLSDCYGFDSEKRFLCWNKAEEDEKQPKEVDFETEKELIFDFLDPPVLRNISKKKVARKQNKLITTYPKLKSIDYPGSRILEHFAGSEVYGRVVGSYSFEDNFIQPDIFKGTSDVIGDDDYCWQYLSNPQGRELHKMKRVRYDSKDKDKNPEDRFQDYYSPRVVRVKYKKIDKTYASTIQGLCPYCPRLVDHGSIDPLFYDFESPTSQNLYVIHMAYQHLLTITNVEFPLPMLIEQECDFVEFNGGSYKAVCPYCKKGVPCNYDGPSPLHEYVNHIFQHLGWLPPQQQQQQNQKQKQQEERRDEPYESDDSDKSNKSNKIGFRRRARK